MESINRENLHEKNNAEKKKKLPSSFRPLASSTMRNIEKPDIPEQMQRKAVKKGFNFTLMVIGESGLGKSTFVNTLLNQSLYNTDSNEKSTKSFLDSTTKVEKHFVELDERGVKIRLTIVDTPGFGDGLNCEEDWKPIVDHVDETFYQFFKDECAINRKNIKDNRVHCCLYFISPTGRGLRQIDVVAMKRLHTKVNIVPVIAKADSLTSSELKSFKQKLMKDLLKHQINFYQPPICGSDEEDDYRKQDDEIRSVIPFSVIGSNVIVENEYGRKVRGRVYDWGIAEVENSKHCNFNMLRLFILRSHMQDLKDVTNDILYEQYRGHIIQTRMNRRRDDQTITSRTDSHTSSIDDYVDTNSLLQEKEEEIQKMKARIQLIESQMSDKNDASDILLSTTKSSETNQPRDPSSHPLPTLNNGIKSTGEQNPTQKLSTSTIGSTNCNGNKI